MHKLACGDPGTTCKPSAKFAHAAVRKPTKASLALLSSSQVKHHSSHEQLAKAGLRSFGLSRCIGYNHIAHEPPLDA